LLELPHGHLLLGHRFNHRLRVYFPSEFIAALRDAGDALANDFR
jgi:hypothetical protein